MNRKVAIYSRFVFLAKIVFPLVALGLLATVFLLTESQTVENGLKFSQADLIELASGLEVRKPKFSGSNARGDTYYFSADLLQPDAPEPNRIDIVGLSGDYQFFSGIKAEITAGKAILKQSEQSMRFFDGVLVVLSNGLRAASDGLLAELGEGRLTSDGQVTATSPMGNIEAGTMRIETIIDGEEENRMIWFENGVTLSFKPEYWIDEEAEQQ